MTTANPSFLLLLNMFDVPADLPQPGQMFIYLTNAIESL